MWFNVHAFSLQEKFLEALYCVLWVGNLVANGSWVLVYLMVIAALVALVAVEVDLIVLVLHVLEAEGLVPALWEHVERNLTANRELQIQVSEFLFKSGNEGWSHSGSLVELFEVVSLLFGAISSNRRYVHHAVSVLQKCTTVIKIKRKVSI